MPVSLLRRLHEEIPRLHAREALRGITVAQAGSGFQKASTVRGIISSLRAQAEGEVRARSSGLEALAALRAANERARREGRLWEQLQAGS